MTFSPPSAVEVEGQGCSSDAVTWLGRAAGAVLREQAVRARLPVGESADVVTLTPGAVATSFALQAFVRASSPVAGDVVGRLAGPVSRWSDEPAFGPPARLVRLRGGGGSLEARIAAATTIDVPVRHRRFEVAVGGSGVETLDLSPAVLVSTHHWSGVLWANLLALPPTLWRALVADSWWGPVRLLLSILRARSLHPMRVAGRLNRLGRGVVIHPSAVVEGSFVGDGARVGPCAVIRGAILGPGCIVESHALVAYSVLGASVRVQRHGWAQYSVLGEGSSVGGAMQLGVLGREASLKGGSYLMDQGLLRGVRASVGGSLVPAPFGVLGVGVGAGSVVGSGVWIAPGRTVPPGVVILGAEQQVLTHLPQGISGVVRVSAGTVERL